MKRRRLLGILGALLFVAVLYRLGIRRSLDALIRADPGVLGLAFLAFLLSQAVRLAKWTYFYRLVGVPFRFPEGAQFYFNLKLLGTLTPGRVGEFLPAVGAPDRQGPLLSCAAFDRLAESLATVLLAIGAFLFLIRGATSGTFLAASVALFFAIVAAAVLCARNAWMTRLGRWAGRLVARRGSGEKTGHASKGGNRIGEEVERLRESLRVLFRPRAILFSFVLTALAVASDVLFWKLTFRSVGIDLSAGALLAAIAIFNMTGFFSPTPAGLGVSDAAFVVFLRSAGVEGPFGSFLLLLRLTVVLLTALCAWVFALAVTIRGKTGAA